MTESIFVALEALLKEGGTTAVWVVVIFKTASILVNVMWAGVLLACIAKICKMATRMQAADLYRDMIIRVGRTDEHRVAVPEGWTVIPRPELVEYKE